MERVRKPKNYWKSQADQSAHEARRLHEQLRVNMQALDRTTKERDDAQKRLHERLINEIGHMMECNAKLAEAAARIILPNTYSR